MKVLFPRLLPILDAMKFVLFLCMLLMFINFNAKVAQQSIQTEAVAKSTNDVVKGQADILKAIKQVTDDTHTTAAQQTSIIICMLQVPVSYRTTDLQALCRKQGLSVENSNSGTTRNSNGTNQSVSSSNSTPAAAPVQSNNSQKSMAVLPRKAPSPFSVERIFNSAKNIINGL